MVSNGFFAEPLRARRLAAAGLRAVQISVDGVDARDHCAVRGCSPLDYYRALRAIRVFQEAGMVVDVATIIAPANIARAGEMALLCEALRVRCLRYCSFVPTGRAVDDPVAARFRVAPEALDRFLALLRDINAQADAPITALTDHGIGPWNEAASFRCDAGENVAYISSEGNLYPCPGRSSTASSSATCTATRSPSCSPRRDWRPCASCGAPTSPSPAAAARTRAAAAAAGRGLRRPWQRARRAGLLQRAPARRLRSPSGSSANPLARGRAVSSLLPTGPGRPALPTAGITAHEKRGTT